VPAWLFNTDRFGRSSLDRIAAGCQGEAMGVDVLRYAAFTDDPASGNPAGVAHVYAAQSR
jgi:hypothetical protein